MVFLIAMTNFLLLIGAGLFSRAIWAFQTQAFNKLLGADVDDAGAAGDGPGSYDVRGNVWHLNCCNPENKSDADGWSMFSAIFGWTNSATLGSILAYVFYWLAAIACLIYLKFTEVRSALCAILESRAKFDFLQGRTKLLGRESAAGARRRQRSAVNRGDSEAASHEKA